VIHRLALIGLGLIGGSFARALRAAGAVGTVVGTQTEAALALGVIDQSAATAAAAVRDAQVVMLAVPVLHTAEALKACLDGLGSTAVVTDVGSTKGSVLADVSAICGGQLPPWFVAGHPIAGTEKSGVRASFAELFRGHRVILTPHAGQDPQALRLVSRLWQATGARVVEMDADRHDAIFAATSHLPHLLAYSFVEMLAARSDAAEIFPNAGGGFRDFTRIASSSPRMWHDIVRANAPAVQALLAEQILSLQRLQAYIADGQWQALEASFSRARAARERHLSQIE
jgi:prephenate dehydrogenase